MGKTQQTLWLAGFTGLSATCITSFCFLLPSWMTLHQPPDRLRLCCALLAANTDSDQTTLTEVKQMLDGHFARLTQTITG